MGNENLKIVKTNHCIIKYIDKDNDGKFNDKIDTAVGLIRFDNEYKTARFDADVTPQTSVFTRNEVAAFLTERKADTIVKSSSKETLALDEYGNIKDKEKYTDTKALLNTLKPEEKTSQKQVHVTSASKNSVNSSDPWQPVLDAFGVTSALNDLRKMADEAWTSSKNESTPNKTKEEKAAEELEAKEAKAKEEKAAETRAKEAKERAAKGEQKYESPIANETTKPGGMDSWLMLDAKKNPTSGAANFLAQEEKKAEDAKAKSVNADKSKEASKPITPKATQKPDFATHTTDTPKTIKKSQAYIKLESEIESEKARMATMTGRAAYTQRLYVESLEQKLKNISPVELESKANALKAQIANEEARMAKMTGRSAYTQKLYVDELKKKLAKIESQI